MNTLSPIFILLNAAPANGVVMVLFSPMLPSSNSLSNLAYSSVIGSVWLNLNNNFVCFNNNSLSSSEILSKSILSILSLLYISNYVFS